MPVATGKTRVTIQMDDELLDWFRNEVERAGGGDYQAMINLALREYVGGRRIAREEPKRPK